MSMDENDEFSRYADMAKTIYSYVAVCRNKHGSEDLFHVVFDSEEDLSDFLARNDGDTWKTGFYAKGFSQGKYLGENT